jgi:hypothetical protein
MRPPPWIVEAFLESYIDWREQCEQVRAAYERWTSSEPSDRRLAFAAYRAALDREECAAARNGEWAEQLHAETS